MPPQFALVLSLGFTIFLFIRDRQIRPFSSSALWIPLIWLTIIATRPISSWFGVEIHSDSPQANTEGSALDANIYLALIIASIITLSRREVKWIFIFRSNPLLFLFFAYFGLSTVWSEYPFVAFKRWIKDIGNILMIVVILTDKNPLLAIKTVFLRYAYFALPLSYVFIKYFPDMGRYLDRYTWEYHYCGIATEKNALGALTFVSGLFIFYDVYRARQSEEYPVGSLIDKKTDSNDRRNRHVTKRSLHSSFKNQDPIQQQSIGLTGKSASYERRKYIDFWLSLILLYISIWLIGKANSSTALLCFCIGVAFIVGLRVSVIKDQIKYLGTYFLILIILAFGFYGAPELRAELLELLGEDMTLTGRTDLWADVISAPINPILGEGYQSFWMSSYVDQLWKKYIFHPNQAHNGYIDTYLNGGLVGLILLILSIIYSGYSIKKAIIEGRIFSDVKLAFLFISVLYNWTEGVFNKLSIVWLLQLIASISYLGDSVNDGLASRALEKSAEGKARSSGVRIAKKYRD